MPANPMRGEAALGEQIIVVDFNGFCSLEGELGKKVPEILSMMEAGLGFADLRMFISHFLAEPMSEHEVGELIGTVGFPEALAALSKAVNGFFADRKESAARPRKAA